MTDEKTPSGDDESAGRPQHLQPVAVANAPKVLIPKHREDLEGSGLNAETIEKSGIYSETTSPPIADALGWRWRGGGGMVIPFRDYDSRAVVLRRVKPDKPRFRVRKGKRKPIKYEQPPGVSPYAYFGPGTLNQQRLGSTDHVVWTEGEKKTLTLDQMGFAAIGLTGVHNFHNAEKFKNGDGLTWAESLVKIAARFVRGKQHTIAFDSDAMTNDDVMLAARRLAGLLLDTGASRVSFLVIPGGDEKVGIDDFLLVNGEEKTRALFEQSKPVRAGEDIAPIAPRDPLVKLDSLAWIKPAKVGKDLRLPPRFEIRSDRSLWVEPLDPAADFKEFTRSVVLPVRLMKEHGGASERVELAWFARGDWHRVTLDRQSIRDARKILVDTPPSMAITSNNASAMVGWFSEYMRHNEERLRCVNFVSIGGWQEDTGGTCFMLNEPISKGVEEIYVGDETGDRAEILAALKPKGKLDKHVDVLRECFEADPTCAIVTLAAFAAPLLKIFSAPNFTVNLYGDSSTGKTSMMKVAASSFGDPTSPQWVASWNATGTAMEVRAETLCDLPLPFDEAGAGDERIIEKVVYMINNGTGRARSNQSLGIRETPSWRCVSLSTGERELVDRHAATGAQIRVLQFRVARFGGERGASWVDSVRERAEANCGRAGRAWIEALVDTDDWRGVVEEYEGAKAWFREHANGPLMKRQAVYFALLWITECLMHDVLGIGNAEGETVKSFFLADDNREEIESASDRALESVSQWLVASSDAFPGLESDAKGKLKTKRAQYNGRPLAGVRHGHHVYILTSALRERFAQENISYSEVVKAWQSAGISQCDGKRPDTRIKFNGERVRMVAIACSALDVEPFDAEQAAQEEFRG